MSRFLVRYTLASRVHGFELVVVGRLHDEVTFIFLVWQLHPFSVALFGCERRNSIASLSGREERWAPIWTDW